MGGCNSCCIPHKNPNLCRENHAKTPKVKGHSRNLSATFMVKDEREDVAIEKLNINSATEEELMTLPGINRQTAHNIVEYRRQLGGFKKVEDLVLVSGVGATKFSQIRLEITCGHKKLSRTNTPAGSKNDINVFNGPDNGRIISRNRSSGKVNVNSGNVFQLMKAGLEQNLAENIVTYRDKKGSFKTIDELTRVKGISNGILSAIRHKLTLDLSDLPSESSFSNFNGGVLPSGLSTPKQSIDGSGDSVSFDFRTIPGPWSMKHNRPDVIPFSFRQNNRPAIRIASWNLERCVEDKMDNIGVKEVVCMTILENGISLIAFQELASKKVLDKLCEELNNPTLPIVHQWQGHRGHWKCVTSPVTGRMFQAMEYNGFLYDTNIGVEYIDSRLLKDSAAQKDRAFVRKPFIGLFKIDRFDFVLVSVHLKATGLSNEDLDETQQEVGAMHSVISAVEEQLPGENDLLLVGDFNLAPDAKDFDVLREKGYHNAITEKQFTNISSKTPEGSQSYDNIWISRQSSKAHTGSSGVIRRGLTSPWIPDGWSWGGVASDHCPVWAEFYTGKDYDRGDISIGLEGITINSV